jgi:hypothetical protein
LLGEGGRQFFLIIQYVVPTVAFTLLFRRILRREDGKYDKFLIAGYIGVRFMTGLSSGWLGQFISIVIICAAIYISERRKIPKLIVTAAVLFFLFFQVGKEDFRKTYWYGDQSDVAEAGKVEKVEFWLDASVNKWEEALVGASEASFQTLIFPSLSRVALLTQTANVIDQTPEVVPYQYGRLYTYIFISPIPRFLWADKPSVSEANQYYQVAYNITPEEYLTLVSISIGILTESYINFGWFGVVGVMFLVGIFFDFYQNTFLAKSSGVLMNAIGFVLLPPLLGLESQLAVYMSGILQQILVIVLVLLPVISFSRPQESPRKLVEALKAQSLLISK